MRDAPDGNEVRDDVVDDVADALTLNRDVPWDQCTKLAPPAHRRRLDNLRALAPAVLRDEAAGVVAPAAATMRYLAASAFARRATQVVLAIAAVEVAATLALLSWNWGEYHREHREVALFIATSFIGNTASAGPLLFAGRRDPRTWLLGGFFLLKATLGPVHILPAVLSELPPPGSHSNYLQDLPASISLFGYLYVHAYLLAAAFLWAFAQEYPRVHRRTWLDSLASRMVPICLVSGFVTWAVSAATMESARAGLTETPVSLVFDSSIAVQNVLALAAVATVIMRARAAPADEVRRVVVFSAGFLLFMGMAAAYDVAEVFSPGSWVSNYRWSAVVLMIQVLRFPGMVLLWYSVLVREVPHPREVVRTHFRRLLTRPGLLGTLAAAPAVGLAGLVVSRQERTVGAAIADPWVQSLFAACGILLLAALGRRRILRRLDTWTCPEIEDQRQTLATAMDALARAGSIRTINRAVARAVGRGCGSAAVLMTVTDAETQPEVFHASDAKAPPLSRGSAIVHMLEAASRTLRVHPDDDSSIFALLPQEEVAWVVETEADGIVPVPGPGELSGVLVVGRRFDGRTVRNVDLPFLEALGSAAGLATERLNALRLPRNPTTGALPARECPVCGLVAEVGDPPGCGCGSAYVEADVPHVLVGKFRMTRLLGAGGMGRVYLARDLRLERNVAVKTLAGMSHLGLKTEAWAMAELTHPAVAQVLGSESWRGRLFLVVEYLSGGTLADRLLRGRVSGRDAVLITGVLADALAALHAAGYLHGDIKPSNIGFAAGGSPKLLDFGLAREANAVVAGGTLSYASPEVLSGRQADEADDVWSLCVVLYEMVSGEHPFAGDGVEEVSQRIMRRRLGHPYRVTSDTVPSSTVLSFAASVLSAAKPLRPATAGAFAEALSAVIVD